MTTALSSFCSGSLTRTKLPGQSLSSRLSKRALALTVPVAASIALSTKCSLPVSGLLLPGSCASTFAWPDSSSASSSGSSDCGRLKATSTGSICVSVVSVVTLACTALPANTGIAPTRPAPGARTWP